MKYGIGLVILAVFVAGCSGEIVQEKQVVNPITNIGQDSSSWKSIELTNIQNENSFSIADYKQPVLVETFAVWCPTCLRQQQAFDGLDIAHVVVNTDPSESQELVQEYISEHGFSAPYVIASEEFTSELIDTFGIGIINAPSSPIVLVCPGEDGVLLDRGFKSAEILQDAVDSCA
jgi:thiol-disulfide isomerase/thioredoxin